MSENDLSLHPKKMRDGRGWTDTWWFYEEAGGLSVVCTCNIGESQIATVSLRAIKAYLKRLEK